MYAISNHCAFRQLLCYKHWYVFFHLFIFSFNLTLTGKSNGFFNGFVNDYLANHSEAQQMIKLEEGSQHFLLFNDIERVTEIYCDHKGKTDQDPGRILKKRKDNFKNTVALSEKKGLLEKVGFGTEFGKEYLKYEIKNDKLWDSLKQKYSVSRNFHMVIKTLYYKLSLCLNLVSFINIYHE